MRDPFVVKISFMSRFYLRSGSGPRHTSFSEASRTRERAQVGRLLNPKVLLMGIKPPRQTVTPPGVIVPATLLAILEQRSFDPKKL